MIAEVFAGKRRGCPGYGLVFVFIVGNVSLVEGREQTLFGSSGGAGGGDGGKGGGGSRGTGGGSDGMMRCMNSVRYSNGSSSEGGGGGSYATSW